MHNNTGNPDTYDPSIQIDPQNSILLGFSFKTNYTFLFTRFGADITFLINKGRVRENSSEIASTDIQYLSLPLFIGCNFRILDTGNLYMGPGVSYFSARGRINSTVPTLSEDISATGWGFGFITGIEYSLLLKINIYFEWEYLNGRSGSSIQSQSAHEWDDMYIDFTGHRLMLGVRYYLI